MNTLAPLETLYEVEGGKDLPLPPSLAALYGRLQFPSRSGSPHVIGNFVSTLDGIVSLDAQTSGGEISGFNQHDRMVMGLLRAVADVVIVGAGTLRADPHHLWTADYIYPSLSAEYQQLRANLKNGAHSSASNVAGVICFCAIDSPSENKSYLIRDEVAAEI